MFRKMKADLSLSHLMTRIYRYFSEKYTELDSETLEYVVAVEAKNGNYLNAFYLYGYDYGISLFMPVSIAPEAIMREALNDIQLWND